MAITQQQAHQAAAQFGPNVCHWPSALQDAVHILEPGLSAACAAGNGFDISALESLLQPGTSAAITAGGQFSGLTGLNAIGDFFQRLSQKQTWVRVGEFVAGGILIYVGVKAFFPSVVNSATAPVKKAAKASVFL